MAERIAVAFQKGGTGKTFTATNLAGGLADRGFEVLLLDLDPQGSLTANLGKQDQYMDTSLRSLDEVLLTPQEWDGAQDLIETDHPEFDFIPANNSFSGNSTPLDSAQNSEQRLNKVLEKSGIDEAYDYVVMDCPPSLGPYTHSAIIASLKMVVPVSPEFEMTHSTQLLKKAVEELGYVHGVEVEFLAFVLNKVDYGSMSNQDEKMVDWFWSTFEQVGHEVRKRAAFDRSKWDGGKSIYTYTEARNCDEFDSFDGIVQSVVEKTNPGGTGRSSALADGGEIQ